MMASAPYLQAMPHFFQLFADVRLCRGSSDVCVYLYARACADGEWLNVPFCIARDHDGASETALRICSAKALFLRPFPRRE